MIPVARYHCVIRSPATEWSFAIRHGLKMAEVYSGLDVIILPSSGQFGINPLNLQDSIKLFGIESGKE